jgi:UPF0716 family protein affecting phage T7 exclusion
MTTVHSPFNQHTLATIMVVMVVGALAMIWPGIIALFLGVFLLIKSCSAEQEIAGLSWTEIGNLSIVFGS